MQDIIPDFEQVKSKFDLRDQKYLHIRSVENFLKFLAEFEDREDIIFCETLLSKYFLLLKEMSTDLTLDQSEALFEQFIFPLGERFEKIGFRYYFQLKYQIFCAIHIDFLLWLAFFSYPIPLTTVLIFVYFFVTKLFRVPVKRYGMFY